MFQHVTNSTCDAPYTEHRLLLPRRHGVDLPSPTLQWARAHPHLHFHFEHHEARSGRPRQTKSTLSPLTRSNRRHGQYVESCCALELDGILIFPQSQRTRLSTTRARRLTRTGTQTSIHDRPPRPNHRRTNE